jgi:hypothetical protein
MNAYDTHPTYGELVSTILKSTPFRMLSSPELSKKAAKRLQTQLKQQLRAEEEEYIVAGANYARTQIDTLRKGYAEGLQIEFETIGPYLANYLHAGGVMTLDNLIPEDRTGLQLAILFRSLFPKARLVALCDEYNEGPALATPEDSQHRAFTREQGRAFIESFEDILLEVGVISSRNSTDHLLLAESKQAERAELLVSILRDAGYIEETKSGIYFSNPNAENPLHRRFCLRTPHGRWICETLDAAGFLDPGNNSITHIVVLPDYMKAQQDRVWEILRVLGLQPSQHHNIFFDPLRPTEDIVSSISKAFSDD